MKKMQLLEIIGGARARLAPIAATGLRLHKRALRVLLDDHESTFEELLRERGEHTIHTRNLQKLMLEVYICLTSDNPSFLWDFFKRKPVNYNLRVKDLVQLSETRTLRYGNDSLTFRGSILWNALPDTIKSANSVSQFKNNNSTHSLSNIPFFKKLGSGHSTKSFVISHEIFPILVLKVS